MSRLPTFPEIGSRIKILRERRGLSQEELACMINVSRPVMTKIEAGKKAINSLELRRIADMLKVSADELTRPLEEEDDELVGRFRAKRNTDDPTFLECLMKIEHIFDEILGQVRMARR